MVANYLLTMEQFPPVPSIRLTVNVSMEETDVAKLVSALEHSAETFLEKTV